MASGRLERIVRILGGLEDSFAHHAESCRDRVVGIALSDRDWDELGIAEIWGLPVLAWDELDVGRVKLLCEANGSLIPPHDTVEDLQDIWKHRLRVPAGEL